MCSSVKKSAWIRFLPLVVLVVFLVLIIHYRLYEYFTFSALQQHYQLLQQWTVQYYLKAVLLYMVIYFIAVAVSIPGASILTLLGGFLFGEVWGTVYVVVAATCGALVLFLAVKMALGQWLAQKASGWVGKLEKGFNENALSYLLFLRLVPLFPFWVVNIVSGILGVRFRTFLLATFFGIIPGSFVYVLVGNGLGSVFERGETPNLGIIFEPQILVPVVALAVLALAPIIYQKIKAKKHA